MFLRFLNFLFPGPIKEAVRDDCGGKYAKAHSALRDGFVAEAKALCEEIVKHAPDCFDAVVLLAEIAEIGKERSLAIELYAKAIVLMPADAHAYYKQGNLLKDNGELHAAMGSYDSAIALDASHAAAFCNRGFVRQRLDRQDDALADYERAIALNPLDALSHYNRAALLREIGRPEQALESFGHALTVSPNFADALCNRGTLRQELKQWDAAMTDYDRAIEINPDFVQALFARGTLQRERNNLSAALEDFTRAIALDQRYANAYCNRGVVRSEMNQWDAALSDLKIAIDLKPKLAEAHSNRGDAFMHLSQYTAAVASYDQAIALQPNFAEAHNNRACTLLLLKQVDAAIAGYDRALALKPNVQFGLGMRRYAKMHICDWNELETDIEVLIEAIERNETVSPPLPILALIHAPHVHRKAAQNWTKLKYPTDHSLPPIPRRKAKGKIRLGYFSADFCDHPVALLAVGFLEHHDRSKFEVIAFSFGPDTRDPIRERLMDTFDQFLDVRGRSDRDICLLSRSLDIDIAVDLSGHTAGSRTGIFALRAAPIQINFLGYPGTVGAEYIDYIVGDEIVVPESLRKGYTEKVISLPSTFLPHDAHRRISDRAFTRKGLGLPAAGFVFCCFNNNYKITPSVFDSWMKILNRTPGSVLWLSRNDSSAAANLRREAAHRCIDPGRLVFADRVLSSADHLARHGAAGLFLDTSPYNAHATALDALWSGLPILTLISDGFAGRVAASLLIACGLRELVASTAAQYEDLAVELAGDPSRLEELRQRLAVNRLTTPVFDTPLYARNLEAAFLQAYQRHYDGMPPEHLMFKGAVHA